MMASVMAGGRDSMKPKTSGKPRGAKARTNSVSKTKISGRAGTAAAATKKRTTTLRDDLTGRDRETISFQTLRTMMVESTDKLPMPAEFRCMIGKGKKRKLARVRREWVGFGWTGDKEADGTEPLLVLEEEDFQVAAVHGN